MYHYYYYYYQQNKRSGIVKCRSENNRNEKRKLYVQGIEHTWTPMNPVTIQFAEGGNKTAWVVRKHFPLRPAAAKAFHRSQGGTETRVVVNFSTRKTVPHMHYVGLTRVTDIKGLYISDLCESKIAFNPDVKKQMERSRSTTTGA